VASLRNLLFELTIAFSLLATEARAAGEDEANVVEARNAFVQGVDLAKQAQWAEALAAYERSAKLRPHAVTTYNIAVCHRAIGSYTLAREMFSRALSESAASSPPQLADSLVENGKGYIGEIDGLLATANVHLAPANAAIAVDGRPLAQRTDAPGSKPVFVAGVRPPGPGEASAAASGGDIKLSLNPGAHVFTVSRPGFADAVINRTLSPGANVDLKLELDRLPATLHVAATEPGAVVTFDGIDVGVAPIDVSRPAGTYRMLVRKPGFKAYEAEVAVQPGQDLDLRASLTKEERSILSRWWFWTGAGVLVAGVAVGTYFLSRGETTREQPIDGGGLGWAVKLQ
jgi:hypothetical protein